MYSEKEINRAMKAIIWTQCLGLTAGMMFSNNFILTYLKNLGCQAEQISFLNSLPSVTNLALGLPFAFLADRYSKRLLGTIGCFILAISFVILFSASFDYFALPLIWTFFVIYSVGGVFFNCTWFGLLSPIIPAEVRGSFFGKLRISWQLVGIALTYLITQSLDIFPGMGTFQVILIILVLFLFLRIIPYLMIPEKKEEAQQREPLKVLVALKEIKRHPRFLKFCLYRLTLGVATGAIMTIIGLMQKDVLNMSDDQVVKMGNYLFIGSLAGYYLGGKLADKIGNSKIFNYSHLGITAVLFILPLRISPLFSPTVLLPLFSFSFGLFVASFGIAQTSEMFALIPTKCRAFSTTFAGLASTFGVSLSSLLLSFSLKFKLFPSFIVTSDNDFRYDYFLVICGVISTAVFLLSHFTSWMNFYDPQKKEAK